MNFVRILYEKIAPDIVKVTMNRPEKRNAMDALMLEEVQDAFVEADIDEDVRVIILAGMGKDFSAGHDLLTTEEHKVPGGEEARGPVLGRVMKTRLTGLEGRLKREDHIFFNQAMVMRNVSKPTIAMVQGNCLSGGWLNASMCDLIVASDDAKFGDPMARMTSAGVEVLFHPYDVGFRRAKYMLWTGDTMAAQEAFQVGLVSKVVSREKLEEETLALARRIAMNFPVAVSFIKRSINYAADAMGQKQAWQYHMLAHVMSHFSDERKRFHEESRQALQRGGVKEMLNLRDAKFRNGETH